MPNAYGFDFRNPALMKDIGAAGRVYEYFSQIEKLGMMHFSLVCGFWYEWSLGVPLLYGIDLQAKKAIFYDDGMTKMNSSTWELCGKAVANIVSLPKEELDTKWKNKSFYVSSFRASQREMLDSVHRVLGTSDADWTIEYEPTKQRYEGAMQDVKKGDPRAFAIGESFRPDSLFTREI